MSSIPPLRDLLLEQNLVSPHFLKPFCHLSCEQLFSKLQSLQILSEKSLHHCLETTGKIKKITLENTLIDPDIHQEKDTEIWHQHGLLPLYQRENGLVLAASNPYKNIFQNASEKIDILLMSQQEIDQALQPEDSKNAPDIIQEAIRRYCSDIHFSHDSEGGLQIQFRQHGCLVPFSYMPKQEAISLIQTIKLESGIELGVHVSPQDGQLQWNKGGKSVDVRVSTLPTLFGEDIACRLLYQDTQCISFQDCGMHNNAIRLIQKMCQNLAGIILVTGPTGSGKTTTLYTLLRHLQVSERGMIVTLEDPVEKHMSGIRQSSINEAAGYTFAKGLKAVLRQDPDIILVGEIRDENTAAIAIEAAYTGHLVLASLHTHDVRSTLLRLKTLGTDPFLLGYALKGIIAQKLTPVVCQCQSRPSEAGCNHCHGTGVVKRTLAQEVLNIETPYFDDIFNVESVEELGEYIQKI